MIWSDTWELVGAGVEPRALLQDETPTRVPHGWHPRAFPWESSLVPPGFPQTTLFAHNKVAGLYLRENKWGPEGRTHNPVPSRVTGTQNSTQQ